MSDAHFLLAALKLAEITKGFCSPNPAVGALVVKNNEIIGKGYHCGPGTAHAEVEACKDLSSLEDAVLYVTLEPCCHFGRTPPCTEFIFSKGIKTVVFGYRDPNPLVLGKGEASLQKNGVDCRYIKLPEIEDFYKSYSHWTKTKRPRVIGKLAISLDAKIADASGQPVAITGPSLQNYTHSWRRRTDAILTSVHTIINDDPSLNVRLEGEVIAKPLYILDTNLILPLSAKIFHTTEKVTVFYSREDKAKLLLFEEKGITCYKVANVHGLLDLEEIIRIIGEEGVHELWLEAGGRLFSSFIRSRLLQKGIIYIAPKLLGIAAYPAFFDVNNIFSDAENISWHSLGNDAVCEIEWE